MITDAACTPAATHIYPIRWNRSADGSGSGGSMRELRLNPDDVHLGWNALIFGGPTGIGALVVTGGIELAPLLRGGGQEHRRRAGTENLPGIAGFAAAAAAEIADYERVAALRDGLEAESAMTARDAVVLGAAANRLPNTSAIAMPGVAAETQVVALDLDGVMVSAGAACSSGKVGPSHVLAAMGVAPEIAASTIRVSLGWSSSEAEIDHFLRAWTALYRRCRRLAEGARAA